MKKTPSIQFFSLLFSGSLLLAPLHVFSQDESMDEMPEEESSSEAVSEQAISQGRAAVLLANSLGLYVDQAEPLTPVEAIMLLTSRGISPLGGWELNGTLTTENMARIIVQSLGLDEEFTEEQRNDPTAQAYKDILIEEYDVDIDNLLSSGVELTSGTNPAEGEPSDPQQEETSDPQTLVSTQNLQQVIAVLVPTPGGTGGQVDDDSSDITPSAP